MAGAVAVAAGTITNAMSAVADNYRNIRYNEPSVDCGGSKDASNEFLSDKLGKIADKTGYTKKEVRNAIEKVKQGGSWRNGGKNRNPDVMVDIKTGEVYPKTPNGSIGDSIGNIFDYLP